MRKFLNEPVESAIPNLVFENEKEQADTQSRWSQV